MFGSDCKWAVHLGCDSLKRLKSHVPYLEQSRNAYSTLSEPDMPTIAEYFSAIVELIRGERGDVSYHSTKVEAQGLSNRCS
jgi:hypothetical protein